MPSTCMKMTQWASACGNPQPTMASGEALMMKDIVPNASMPAITDAMKRGWLAIARSGRGGAAISAWLGVGAAVATDGKLMKDMIVKTMTCRHENGGIGRKIYRRRQIVRHAHEAGADHGGGDAAGRHPRNRLGAVVDRHQLRRGEAIHLQACHRIAEDEAADAHDRGNWRCRARCT